MLSNAKGKGHAIPLKVFYELISCVQIKHSIVSV